jgi:hypothetical protein
MMFVQTQHFAIPISFEGSLFVLLVITDGSGEVCFEFIPGFHSSLLNFCKSLISCLRSMCNQESVLHSFI